MKLTRNDAPIAGNSSCVSLAFVRKAVSPSRKMVFVTCARNTINVVMIAERLLKSVCR